MTQTYAWGINPRGQLAAAFHSGQEWPISCTALGEPVAVGGSYKGFTVSLYDDGSLTVLGGGVNGEMGNGGHKASYYLPVKPSMLIPFTAFDCGGAHILALLADGRCASWGGNSFGTLGNGTSGEGEERAGTALPYIIPGLDDVVQVSTSNGIAAALHDDGTVSTWGTGSALGRAVQVSTGWVPGRVPGLTNVKALATGGFGRNNHVIALLADGTVVQWGAKSPCGTAKDLLVPTPVAGLSGIFSVAAGPAQSFAVDEHGDAYAWGGNNLGQLFLPPAMVSVSAPVKVSSNVAMMACGFQFSLMLRLDGTVEGVGRNDGCQLPPPGVLRDIDWISAGEQHSFAQGHGAPLAPPITTQNLGAGKVEVSWSSPPVTKPWEVSSHVLGRVVGPVTKYPADTRSAVISTTPGVQTEIRVRNSLSWARFPIVVA